MKAVLRQILRSVLWLAIAVTLVVLTINTDPGRRFVVWATIQASGGNIVPAGLSGKLPFAPRLERLEIRDGSGPWLRFEGIKVTLDHRRLLHGELAVSSAKASSMSLIRLPDSDQNAPQTVRIPFRVAVHHLAIEALALAPWPEAPELAIDGSAFVGAEGIENLNLSMTAAGRADRYWLEAVRAGDRARIGLVLREFPGGLGSALARAAGANLPPDFGSWSLDASAEGPLQSLRLGARLDAGALHAGIEGSVDWVARSSEGLRLFAKLPAMGIADNAVTWEGIRIAAALEGTLDTPRIHARAEADGLGAGGISAERVDASAFSNGARVELTSKVSGLRSPATLPQSAMEVPFQLWGELAPPWREVPFRLAVLHPLLEVTATGTLADRIAHAMVVLPDLAALGAPVEAPASGNARMDLQFSATDAPRIDATGVLELTQAPRPIQTLLGTKAGIGLSAELDDDAWRIDSARVNGRSLSAALQGRLALQDLDLGYHLELPDLALLGVGWSGKADAQGTIRGKPSDPRVVGNLGIEAVLPGQTRARLTGRLLAQPADTAGSVQLDGDWAGQPVAMQLSADRSPDGGLAFTLGDSHWASLALSGGLHLPPGARLPVGEIHASTPRLEELSPLLSPLLSGQSTTDSAYPVSAGSLDATLVSDASGDARLTGGVRGLRLTEDLSVRTLAFEAHVSDLLGAAGLDSRLRLEGLATEGVSGDLTLSAKGPASNPSITATTALAIPAGSLDLNADGIVDFQSRELALNRLEGNLANRRMRLIAPATLDFSNGGIAVDRLRMEVEGGSIDAAGRLTPLLDLDATVTELPVDLIRLVRPELPLTGTLNSRLRLSGSVKTLRGSLSGEMVGLRMTEGPGRYLPPARLEMAATLAEATNDIDLHFELPTRANLGLRGRVDGTLLSPGELTLRTDGRIDLSLLDPLLTAEGRQLRGEARVDAAITGTVQAPRVDGDIRLAGGTLWDRSIGLALTDAEGRLNFAGDTLRVERLSARSGSGELVLDGTIGLLAPGIPVDLRLIARDARPVQLDLLEATGDADLRLQGHASEFLDATGSVRLRAVEIRIPDRLPPDVAVLQVEERGRATHTRRPVRTGPSPITTQTLRFDLELSAPKAVRIRGRGIDAELGGAVRLTGTPTEPRLTGGFELLKGEYELVGQTLRFNRGRLDFDGAAGLDPNLDLEARVTAAGSTAILQVLGTTSAPRIELRSEPELPEREVLSLLLFGNPGGRLSALQAARLGIAASSLAGLETGAGPRPLDQAFSGLGLDRLSLDSDEQGDTILEGGRQISERVHLGARQRIGAGETEGTLRIEVSPTIRLEADVGTDGGTRAGGAMEFEY